MRDKVQIVETELAAEVILGEIHMIRHWLFLLNTSPEHTPQA